MLFRIRPLLLCIAGLALVAAATPRLYGQIHGVPASVTSLGFGGSTSLTPGVAASVTSLGPNGFGSGQAQFGNCCFNPFFQTGSQSTFFVQGHHVHRNFFVGTVPLYVPYTQVVVVQPVAVVATNDDNESDEEGYASRAPVVERRGSRSNRTRAVAVEAAPAPAGQPVAAEPPAPVVAQPSTVLVFRDGHQTELQNYAIVGDTIFDLTDNRSHKILLAEIDVPATRKANDARGVDFQVPGNSGQ